MGNFFLSAFASFLGGSCTAFVFFWLFRPTIKICDKIARIETEDDKGEVSHFYKFKFYNTSLFPAIDVKPTLYYGVPTERSEANTDMSYKELNLTRIDPFYVEPWKRTSDKTKEAPHCIKISCQGHNFEELLKPYGTVLEFRVNVKHGVSNITRTITKTYNRNGVVKKGDFIFGNNFDIS